jgi:hypothetical protein
MYPTLGSLTNIPIYSAIRNEEKLAYDIVSLNLKRPNYLGQRVILSPFLGLKWLSRNNKVTQDCFVAGADTVDSQYNHLKWSSIGIGAGLDGNWLMCWGFSLVGKADVGLLYPYHRKRNFLFVNAPSGQLFGPIIQTNTVTSRHLDIYARGGMGIGWGSYLFCNRYRLNLSVTYDWLGEVVKLDFQAGMYLNPSAWFMGLSVRGQFDF